MGGNLSIVRIYCTYIVSIFFSLLFLLAKTNRMTAEKKPKNKTQFQFRTKARKASARGIIKR